ncbi:MAG: sodium-translocating pyrophosphatase [Bacteroidia bacterium]|nr:sodium-translocating pyrophosphatase [Bacteroidia bacterium]
MNEIVIYLVPAVGLFGLLIMGLKSAWVSRQEAGDSKMQELAGYIAAGALAFLKAEWKILGVFAAVAAVLLGWSGTLVEHSSPVIAIAFVIGAVFSALAGYIGMKIATKANVRTAHAARTSLAKALAVSFNGGTVMGLGVAGLAVLGLGGLFIVLTNMFVAPGDAVTGSSMRTAIEVLAGFSLGAESIALFARVGGGIYTKAADVGADLVGKVEAGIPEDDVRNPATIADNVGDNVGDVAGMGADLFGSYVATILATMILGIEIEAKDQFGGMGPILLPMVIAGLGLVFSVVGTFFVRIKGENSSVQNALNMGNWSSIIFTAIASYFVVQWMIPADLTFIRDGSIITANGIFYAIITGLVVGTLMSFITEYYTAIGKRPVSSIVRQSSTGHATNVIGGLAVGMESTLIPVIVLAAGIYVSHYFAGLYGVSIAAAGMMATTAMQLAIDAFGPIADNAGGIAEMSGLPKEVRGRTDNLDAVGNTTAATGKGFAIASAALTSLALFAAFVGVAGISHIDIYKADVLAGLFIGAVIPFIFSSLAIAAVGRAAMAMVNEVRRQFREIPGIMEYKAKPEYEKCVAISTQASIREMIAPGLIALITPVIVGFAFGPEVLGGLLAGVTVSGVLMGMFQSNAGGAWDNAKKSFEKGVEINGQTFYKGSEPHKAAVTGDTVGDPFKDTSGPSMNILIKLMSIVSLVIAPHIAVVSAGEEEHKGHDHSTVVLPGAAIDSLSGMYAFDGSHAFVEFNVRHWLSNAKGTISLDSGIVHFTGDPSTSSVDLVLSVRTINTQNKDRDDHLLKSDYFAADSFPSITFSSKGVLASENPSFRYKTSGSLTMRGIRLPVDVYFNYVGEARREGKPSIFTFEGECRIDRTSFKVGEESKGVGSEVLIKFSAETRKAE